MAGLEWQVLTVALPMFWADQPRGQRVTVVTEQNEEWAVARRGCGHRHLLEVCEASSKDGGGLSLCGDPQAPRKPHPWTLTEIGPLPGNGEVHGRQPSGRGRHGQTCLA